MYKRSRTKGEFVPRGQRERKIKEVGVLVPVTMVSTWPYSLRMIQVVERRRGGNRSKGWRRKDAKTGKRKGRQGETVGRHSFAYVTL